MYKKRALFIVFCLISTFSFTQNLTKWDKTFIDFGNVKEEDSVQFFEFKMTNTTKSKILISNILPGCDCTVPTWSKDSINGGKSTLIKGALQVHNRVGKFDKYMDVLVSNIEKTDTIRLQLKGNVLPKPKGPNIDFPSKMGGIRVASAYLNLQKLFTNPEISQHEFAIYNDTTFDITLKIVTAIPPHLKIKLIPEKLKPQETCILKIEYNTKIKNDYGHVADYLEIETNEEKNKLKRFFISADIEEHFPPMTEEMLAQAPKIAIDRNEYNFGSIRAGETPKSSFTITNTGKSTLIIRKLKASCGCTTSEIEKNSLAPSESTKIYISFDSRDRAGTQQKNVYIFSNDPTNPTQLIVIKGYVNR